MKTETCPECMTLLLLCDRCGKGHPEYHPPCPFNGSLNSAEDIRICKTCYDDLCSIVWAFFGRVYRKD